MPWYGASHSIPRSDQCHNHNGYERTVLTYPLADSFVETKLLCIVAYRYNRFSNPSYSTSSPPARPWTQGSSNFGTTGIEASFLSLPFATLVALRVRFSNGGGLSCSKSTLERFAGLDLGGDSVFTLTLRGVCGRRSEAKTTACVQPPRGPHASERKACTSSYIAEDQTFFDKRDGSAG